MEPELTFRTDLYRSAAPFYDRYRPPYPDALLEELTSLRATEMAASLPSRVSFTAA